MPEQSQIDIATVCAQDFSDLAGKEFEFRVKGLTLPITLMEYRENPDGAGPDSKRTPFSLIFQADDNIDHPLIQMKEFSGDICGHENGPIENVWINRTLRPVRMPEGAYFQVIFS